MFGKSVELHFCKVGMHKKRIISQFLAFKKLKLQFYSRYDISNCLFEATYQKVLEKCKCTPYFHWAGVKEYKNFCRGSSLLCMNEILSRLGEFNEVIDNTDKSGTPKRCLAACENQVIYTANIYSQFTVIDCVTCATVIWQ